MYQIRQEIEKKYSLPQKPSKDGYYRTYVKDETKKGGRKQLSAKTIDELIDKIRVHESNYIGSSTKTFLDVFKLVQEQKLQYVKNPDKIASVKNTIGKRQCDYNRFFKNTFIEHIPIDEITKNELDSICLLNLKRYDLKPKAFSALKSILKMIFDLAFEEYWISDNLYSRMNFKKYSDLLVPESKIEERVYSEEEVETIIEELHKKQKEKPAFVPAYALELQILMGLRRGEVAPLMWEDIDDKLIKIHREQITLQKAGTGLPESFKIVNHTKTYVDRVFPITPEIKNLLEKIKEMQKRHYPNSKYLFPANNKNHVITNRAVYRLYCRLIKKTGIKHSDGLTLGTHSFRRNAITKVINSTGGNTILASSLYGNSPTVAKKNYYTGIDYNQALKVLTSI